RPKVFRPPVDPEPRDEPSRVRPPNAERPLSVHVIPRRRRRVPTAQLAGLLDREKPFRQWPALHREHFADRGTRRSLAALANETAPGRPRLPGPHPGTT